MSGRLILAGVLVALLLGGCGDDTRTFSARFDSARGLVVGNDVRVAGAVAGRVAAVELARDGSAEVRFTLRRDDLAPRADAVAAIRPVDLLGDTFLALSPGRARAAQRGPIPLARTSNAPRLDELLAAFRPGVRDGLRALLVESGLALDGRGADLARASVALRPALQAATAVTHEVDGQNGSLERLVPAAEHAATRLAARSAEVGPLVDGLDRTLAATAAETPAISASVRGLPATLDRVAGTSARLERTALRARPVARSLRAGATDLDGAVADLPELAGRLTTTAGRVRPLVRAARSLLVGGSATFGELGRTLQAVRTYVPDVAGLLSALGPAAEGIAQGFLTEFPDQAREPGTQPFDPFADARRGYWRGAAVLSCEAFGLKVEPGCLTKAFPAARRRTTTTRPAATTPTAAAPKPAATAPAPARPATPSVPTLPPTVQRPLDDVQQHVAEPVKGLLDFLLKP